MFGGRRTAARPGANPYEAWALGLKAWPEDPSAALEDLPPLAEDTFDPVTYQRLGQRLHDAISEFMDIWVDRLAAGFDSSAGAHDIARQLVDLRGRLRPRALLAEHPGLPEPIRQALREGLRADLISLQAQLERNAVQSAHTSRTDRSSADQMLIVLRQNSLLYLLPPAPHAPPPEVAATTESQPASRRRFVSPS